MTAKHSLQFSGLRLAWLILSLVLSVGAAWLAAREVSWNEVAAAIARANGWWLLAAPVSAIVTTLLKALRWRALFVPRPLNVSVWDLFVAIVVGQMFNMALPMRAGDVGRAAIIGRPGLSRMTALVTVAAEKWVDIVAAVALALGLLPFMTWPDWVRSPLDVLAAIAVAGIVGLAGLATLRKPIAAALARIEPAERIVQWLRRAWQGVAALRSPGAALTVAGWTALIWALGALTNWLVGQALGLSGNAVMWGFVLLVLQVGVAVPSAPGKIGVFELLTLIALSPFGVEGEIAFAYAVVLHLIVIGPIILGGLALWPAVARVGTVQFQGGVEA